VHDLDGKLRGWVIRALVVAAEVDDGADAVVDERLPAVVAQLPYRGFHAFLARGLTSYAVRHPLRPLPMLRW